MGSNGFDCGSDLKFCSQWMNMPLKIGSTPQNGNATSNIDAEYEALCASYEGALV